MPARDMEGKVALVSAASRGLGRASARAIARRGAKVAICARDGGAVTIATLTQGLNSPAAGDAAPAPAAAPSGS